MKLIVEFKTEDSLVLNSALDYYNNNYKENDNIFYNKEHQSIYYNIECDVMPLEGQRVSTEFGWGIVEFSIYNICKNTDNWFDKSRIVVIEE